MIRPHKSPIRVARSVCHSWATCRCHHHYHSYRYHNIAVAETVANVGLQLLVQEPLSSVLAMAWSPAITLTRFHRGGGVACRSIRVYVRAFPVAATRARNSLPPQTRAASSILTFRQETKSHLFRQSFGWQKSGTMPRWALTEEITHAWQGRKRPPAVFLSVIRFWLMCRIETRVV